MSEYRWTTAGGNSPSRRRHHTSQPARLRVLRSTPPSPPGVVALVYCWFVGRSTGESSVVGSMALHSVRSRDEPCGRPGSRSIRDHCFVWDSNPTKNLLYGALRWWRSKPTNMPAPGRWWVGAFIGPSEPVLGRALDFWINKRVLPDVRPRGVLSYPLVLLGNWSDNPFARPRAGRGKHHAIAVM